MTSMEKVQGGMDPAQQSRLQGKVYFEHLGREITLVFSLASGREQVYVDNKLVSESRNWRFKSVHHFTAGGVSYALEVAMKKSLKGLISGILYIQLSANGTVVDSDQFHSTNHLLGVDDSNPMTWKRGARTLLPFFAGGAIAGFAVAYLGLKYFS